MTPIQDQAPTHFTGDKPRLNPLAFPSETDGLFRMMVAGSFLLAMYAVLLAIVVATLSGVPGLVADIRWTIVANERMRQTVGDRWIFGLSDSEIRSLADDLVGLQLNAFIRSLPRSMLVFLVGVTLIGASVLVYHTSQTRMIRRGKLRALRSFPRSDFASKIQASIDAIARRAGLPHTPEIVVRTNQAGDAQVFSQRGRYILRIDAIPLTKTIDETGDLQRRCSSETFRAKVFHEFGHIVNRDVERSYFSLAIWRIFLFLILFPLMISIILFNTIDTVRIVQQFTVASPAWWAGVGTWIGRLGVLLAQTVALILVMRALWRALLRTREYYADWRAVLWGAELPIKQLLRQNSLRRETSAPVAVLDPDLRHRKAIHGWAHAHWKQLWGFHPSLAARLDRLNNPDSLFKIAPDVAFLTGVLFSFAMIGMFMLFIYVALPLFNLSEVLSWWLARLVIEVVPPLNRVLYTAILLFRVGFQVTLALVVPLLIAYLIVGSLGRQVQRDALGDLLPHRRGRWGYLGLVKPALLLAAGLEFGFLIIPGSPLSSLEPPALFLIPVWFSVFMLLSWFWLVYVRLLARHMLGSHCGSQLPAWKRQLVTGLSLFALWVLYLPTLLARLTIVLVSIVPTMREFLAGTLLFAEYSFGLMFGFSLFVLFTLGLFLFFLWATITVSMTSLVLSLRRVRCPRCGEAVRGWTMVGRNCAACYQPLATWLLVPPDQERY